MKVTILHRLIAGLLVLMTDLSNPLILAYNERTNERRRRRLDNSPSFWVMLMSKWRASDDYLYWTNTPLWWRFGTICLPIAYLWLVSDRGGDLCYWLGVETWLGKGVFFLVAVTLYLVWLSLGDNRKWQAQATKQDEVDK